MRLTLRTAFLSMALMFLTTAPQAFAQNGMLSAEGGKGEIPMPSSLPAPAAAPAASTAAPQAAVTTGTDIKMQADRMAKTMAAQVKAPVGSNDAGTLSPLSPNNPAYSIPSPISKQDEKSLDDNDPLKDPIFRSLSPGMQEQILTEAATYNRDCKVKSSYATFHDCDCLALHFMNQRIRHPDFTQGDIQDKIRLDCADAASIAGYSYDKCVTLYSSRYQTIIKPLCECYARDFATAYVKAPNVSNQYESDLGVKTLRDCRVKLTSMTPDGKQGASSMPEAR